MQNTGALGFGIIENVSIATVSGVSAMAASGALPMFLDPLGFPFRMTGAAARGGTWMGGLMWYGGTGALVGIATDMVARQAPTLVGMLNIGTAATTYGAAASGAGGAAIGYTVSRFI